MSLGVEWGAKYTLTGPDGTIVVFNDSADPNFVGVLSPESSGLDSPDVREDAQDRTEDDGGIHGNFYYGRRPVVLQGTIIASTETVRAERIEKLMRATNAMRGNATLKWKPTGAVEEVELQLRRQQPLRITKGFVKDFQAAMVSADPRIYGTTIELSNGASNARSIAAPATVEDKGGAEPWTNINNVKISDNTRAENAVAAELNTNVIKVNTPHSSIPSNATILGVEAHIERSGYFFGGFGPKDTEVKLEKAGVAVGENKKSAEEWGEAEVTKSYGFSTSLWGTTLTVSDVKHAQFGVRLAVFAGSSGGTLKVDYMDTYVWYSVPDLIIENKGTVDTFPSIKISGELVNPVIENITTGKKLNFTGTIAAGKFWTIDFLNKTVKDEAGVSKYSALSFTASDWWELVPGPNAIRLTSSSLATPAAGFVITSKSAWL